MFQRVVRAAKKWSGRTLRVPVKVSKNTTGQSFRGMDTFSVAATDNRQFMEFTEFFYQITCALPGDELVADTDSKILDMMKLTIQSDTEDMADDLGTIFYSDGTGMVQKTRLVSRLLWMMAHLFPPSEEFPLYPHDIEREQ